ncbi:hypothetical protein AS29_019930 [Bacillus sp. SJS]|nr:hypothetical protein AS29_019930 [Bacillus sp. SJS]
MGESSQHGADSPPAFPKTRKSGDDMQKRTVSSSIKSPWVTESPGTKNLLLKNKEALRFLNELKNKWLIGS